MLHQVLQAFETATGPVSLDELSRELGVERSALEGMIDFWVRKGRLRDRVSGMCNAATCSGCAARDGGCVFDRAAPRTIVLSENPRQC